MSINNFDKKDLLELLELIDKIDKIEIELKDKNDKNCQKLKNYNTLLEEIISEYHNLSQIIYK